METETQPAAAKETERGEMETGQHVAESVVLTKETLSVEAAHRFVGCAKAGAVACFVGTTRDSFEGKRVLCLEYEAYEAMAVRKMEEVCRKARGRFPGVLRLYVAHRVGVVAIGEASVVIAVSSPHRVDAITCSHFMIDELKATVPIWKKEKYEDGSTWKENKEFKQQNGDRSTMQ